MTKMVILSSSLEILKSLWVQTQMRVLKQILAFSNNYSISIVKLEEGNPASLEILGIPVFVQE